MNSFSVMTDTWKDDISYDAGTIDSLILLKDPLRG